jgi:DNA-binding GntR family transcriptional regulator
MPLIATANRADRAADTLAAQIIAGELAPGSRLPEVELAGALGVSRNTFREAIKVLAGRGLVRQHRHRSAVVASLSDESVHDLYRVRRLVELQAIEAASGRPRESFHEIGAAIQRLAGAAEAGTGAPIVEADLAFHQAIVRLHGSQRIELSFAACLDELRLGLALIDARAVPLATLVAEHRAIYSALLDGRIEESRGLLASHLADSERRVLAVLNAPVTHHST